LTVHSINDGAKLQQIFELCKFSIKIFRFLYDVALQILPKSRHAIETKAEFTVVNEHFVD